MSDRCEEVTSAVKREEERIDNEKEEFASWIGRVTTSVDPRVGQNWEKIQSLQVSRTAWAMLSNSSKIRFGHL